MYQIILCTCPDSATARAIAHHLVDKSLAACVNVLPGVTSIYRWQGQIESAEEHLLIIKSQQALFDTIEVAIKSIHPYDVPEIVAIKLDQGSEDYLKWIDSCVSIR